VSNKNAPTKRQRDERARRIAMGIAVIQRPLKHIAGKHGDYSYEYKQARIAANKGNGHIVKTMARGLS
jgi:hypothetical protein